MLLKPFFLLYVKISHRQVKKSSEHHALFSNGMDTKKKEWKREIRQCLWTYL